MKQKGFAPIILLLLVALLAGGGYYVYKNFNLVPKVVPSTSSPIPTATLNPISGWKVYSSKNYSFKYPGDLYPAEVFGNGVVSFYEDKSKIQQCKDALKSSQGLPKTEVCDEASFLLNGVDILDKSVYDERVKKEKLSDGDKIYNDINDPSVFNDALGRIWYTTIPYGECPNFHGALETNNKVHVVYFSSCVSEVEGYKFRDFFTQILSTFKFTDQVACTMEAKVCPDGSSVSRSGPNCEFAPCP